MAQQGKVARYVRIMSNVLGKNVSKKRFVTKQIAVTDVAIFSANVDVHKVRVIVASVVRVARFVQRGKFVNLDNVRVRPILAMGVVRAIVAGLVIKVQPVG